MHKLTIVDFELKLVKTQNSNNENEKKVDFLVEPKANLIFVTMPAYMHRKAFEKGLEYYTWSEIDGVSDDTPVVSRFVVDWSRSLSDINKFLDTAKQN